MVVEERALALLKKLKDVFSIADCITQQTAKIIGGLSSYRAWRYLKYLAEIGYIDIHKVGNGTRPIFLYCLSGRPPARIYIYDRHGGYVIFLDRMAKALEEIISEFVSHTAVVRIRDLKDKLRLPNTAITGTLLIHLVMSLIKDAVIRREVRDTRHLYSVALVVDRDKALEMLRRYRHGTSLT